MNWNPRHHRRRHHRRQHYRHNRRHHYRHNPDMGEVTGLIRNPGTLLGEGAFTALGTYWTIALPNMFGLGFAGTDLISKVLRLAVRGLTGGLLYVGARRMVPTFSSGVLNGALLGAGGGFLFDMLNMSLVVGKGDTAQTGILPGGLAMPSLGAYTRPQVGAYTRPQLGAYTHNMRGGVGAYTRPQLGAWNRAGQFSAAGQFSRAGGFSGFYHNNFYGQ